MSLLRLLHRLIVRAGETPLVPESERAMEELTEGPICYGSASKVHSPVPMRADGPDLSLFHVSAELLAPAQSRVRLPRVRSASYG